MAPAIETARARVAFLLARHGLQASIDLIDRDGWPALQVKLTTPSPVAFPAQIGVVPLVVLVTGVARTRA